MKKLIFDIIITGHHSEYIGHLVDFLAVETLPKDTYYFVVHPELFIRFPEIYEKSKEVKNLIWLPINKEELHKVESVKKIKNSLAQFSLMQNYVRLYQVEHVISLDFHSIKYGILLYKPLFTVSSILFLQFHRFQKNNFKQRIEYLKRYYITKWGVANKQLKKLYVLNDQETVDYMNNEFHTKCFQSLPDPIPLLEPLDSFNIHEHYGIEPHRKIYLHIGALGGRKGTDVVIDSAKYINAMAQKKIAILLVGRASDKIVEVSYNEQIKKIRHKTKAQIIWDNQFVPSKMMKSIFNQCHTVLLPYKNVEFSSGILGHAAAANKIVIATNAGLLRELVLKYKLGELLDVNDASHLALKMEEVMEQQISIEGQQEFVRNHSPIMFAELLLGS